MKGEHLRKMLGRHSAVAYEETIWVSAYATSILRYRDLSDGAHSGYWKSLLYTVIRSLHSAEVIIVTRPQLSIHFKRLFTSILAIGWLNYELRVAFCVGFCDFRKTSVENLLVAKKRVAVRFLDSHSFLLVTLQNICRSRGWFRCLCRIG